MVPSGAIDCVEGPAEGSVVASIWVTVASENEPRAETSSVTFAGTPGPLLSVPLRTAWLASRIVLALAPGVAVTVSPLKVIGQKAIVSLALTNHLAEKVESARAVCFLLDEQLN